MHVPNKTQLSLRKELVNDLLELNILTELFCVQDEAFQLWLTEWATLYEESSQSKEVIQGIVNSYYLVSVVENNFIDGDIFQTFN